MKCLSSTQPCILCPLQYVVQHDVLGTVFSFISCLNYKLVSEQVHKSNIFIIENMKKKNDNELSYCISYIVVKLYFSSRPDTY